MEFFSAEMRRDPFPFYDTFRNDSPVLHLESHDLWIVLDYDGVKRILEDHRSCSSMTIPPGSTGKPLEWLIFFDPPRHTKLRAIINRAFSPRMVAQLETQIRQISAELLDQTKGYREWDLVGEYATVLPHKVIAHLLGIQHCDHHQLKRWSDIILNLAETISGGPQAVKAAEDFGNAKLEMNEFLLDQLRERQSAPRDDLLTQLLVAEIDGERLTHAEILGLFQLLLLAGSETTTNLISNTVICLITHQEQFALLRDDYDLIPDAIEEVLRFRSPIQAVFRRTTSGIQLGNQSIPAGQFVLPMIGSANRDPRQFVDADRFTIKRQPNQHLSFGHGVHFCLGASLSRLEARIAIGDILERMPRIDFADNQPWEPRPAFHVHGPTQLKIRVD